MSYKKNLTDYFHFSLSDPVMWRASCQCPISGPNVHSLLIYYRGVRLISINHCPELNYIGISNMENIYLILSEVLYDRFRVRNTPIEELGLTARCIVSTRDFCCADIELIKILMLILLDFSNVSLHRCGLLIHFKGNIGFWLTHLK